MASADEWRKAAALVRADQGELPRLYTLAHEDGPRFLARFRRRLGEEKIRDLVHDLLAERAGAIASADEPRALFCTALQRRAISWLRRGDAAVVEDAPASRGWGTTDDEPERQRFLVDARAAFEGLSERERAMAVAVALGDDREEVAREFKTSRANVDQIVSRIRRRFAGEGG